MKVAVKTLENKASGDVTLNKDIFGVEPRSDILYRVVNWQLAKRRAGTSKAKGRSEVAGTGKKLWRQKGTGNARVSDGKSPHFRSGGVWKNTTLNNHVSSLPKKIRALGLKMALSAKQAEGKLIVLDAAKAKEIKTKDMAAKLSTLGLNSALFIDGEALDDNFVKSIRNIPYMDVLPAQGANVYDILNRDTLVLTKDAVTKLEERLS
jgi:large subunit ribosomal protein L4